jgi:hypothetical protein
MDTRQDATRAINPFLDMFQMVITQVPIEKRPGRNSDTEAKWSISFFNTIDRHTQESKTQYAPGLQDSCTQKANQPESPLNHSGTQPEAPGRSQHRPLKSSFGICYSHVAHFTCGCIETNEFPRSAKLGLDGRKQGHSDRVEMLTALFLGEFA